MAACFYIIACGHNAKNGHDCAAYCLHDLEHPHPGAISHARVLHYELCVTGKSGDEVHKSGDGGYVEQQEDSLTLAALS